MESEQYWDTKIIEWEDSMQKNGDVSFLEKLASKFRKPLKIRMEMCLSLLKNFGKNKKIVELGCGSGYFAFRLYKESKPKQITGVDISRRAIERAKKIAKDLRLSKEIKFIEGDASSTNFPESDIMVGLGFLDYLNDKEIKNLFKNIKSQYFLFTFSEKKFSVLRFLHLIYLKLQKCPKHYYYTKEQMKTFAGMKYSNIKIISNPKLSFGCIMHNLPIK